MLDWWYLKTKAEYYLDTAYNFMLHKKQVEEVYFQLGQFKAINNLLIQEYNVNLLESEWRSKQFDKCIEYAE